MAYNELYSLVGGGVITDDANATASQILSGYTAYVKGKKITGSIQSQGAQTITPGTSDKTIASGKYLSGTQTIKGDSNLVAGNIKKGTSIFGVSGTYTSDANAAAANILSGKTAYVNGSKITGSMIDRTTVGKNGGIGINSSYPSVPVFIGTAPQTGKALDGNTYVSIGVPSGFYSGGGYVGVNVNNVNLLAGNIKSGVTIFGVSGSYTGRGGEKALLFRENNGSWFNAPGYNWQWNGDGFTCLVSGNYRVYAHAVVNDSSSGTNYLKVLLNGGEIANAKSSYYHSALNFDRWINSGEYISFWVDGSRSHFAAGLEITKI